MEDIYPYQVADNHHPLSWVFFNAGGLSLDLETAEALARHVFDALGCGKPGSAAVPSIKYDALGGSGGPWEPGVWIPVKDARMGVSVTVPHVDVGAMSEAERAELRAVLDAADDAARASSLIDTKGGEANGG